MSGRRVLPILNQYSDVHVMGGPVHKLYDHKRPPSDAADASLSTEMSMTLGAGETNVKDNEDLVELMLCTKGCFKLVTKPDPPAPPPKPSVPNPEGGLAAEDMPPTPPVHVKKAKHHTGPPQVKWRMAMTNVLRVVSLSDWFSTIAKPEDPLSPSTGHLQDIPPYGFVIEYLSDKTAPKDLKKYHPMARAHAKHTADSGREGLRCPQLRYRMYQCGSTHEQSDWLSMWHAVTTNFWQERLEKTIVPDPDVFQFYTWAMVPVTGASSSGLELHHVVLSTTAMYLIPRGGKTGMEKDECKQSVVVANIKKCALRPAASSNNGGAIIMVATRTGPALPALACFTAAQAMELVVELQRIWMLNVRDDEFPFDNEVKK